MLKTQTPNCDSTPLGFLCLGGSCKNSAKPHWCWVSDYYPFGFGMPERSYSSTAAGYRWGFQAQESDDELFGEGNASFFKYRISDNRIGRFFAVDPLAPEYPWNSPYAFSENRVIDGIELEGLEVNLINKVEAALHSQGSHIKVTNVVHIYAHGGPKGIYDQRESKDNPKVIKTATQFNNMMNETSPIWKDRDKLANDGVQIIVVFHSCRTDKFVKEKIAPAFSDVVFVAAEYKVNAGTLGTDTYANEEAQERKDTSVSGSWNIYKGNEKIGTYTGTIKPEKEDKPPSGEIAKTRDSSKSGLAAKIKSELDK